MKGRIVAAGGGAASVRRMTRGVSVFLAAALALGPAPGETAPVPEGAWRVSGHVATADGRRFDVYAVFYGFSVRRFREAANLPSRTGRFVAAAYSIVDESTQRTFVGSRADRCADGLATQVPQRSATVDGWRVSQRGPSVTLSLADGTTKLTLEQRALRAPAVFAGTSSFTRLAARGSLTLAGRAVAVAGTTWVDRIDRPAPLRDALGWDRFEMQFDDGRDVMLNLVRLADGSASMASSGFVVWPGGRVARLGPRDFTVGNRGHTTFASPRTGIRYPSLWVAGVPLTGRATAIEPLFPDQEIALPGGPAWYAGPLDLVRAPPFDGDHGIGYVELTGYDRGRTDVSK